MKEPDPWYLLAALRRAQNRYKRNPNPQTKKDAAQAEQYVDGLLTKRSGIEEAEKSQGGMGF